MPKIRKKSDLSHKQCEHCGRPFTLRKKWKNVWDSVKYFSDRCRNN